MRKLPIAAVLAFSVVLLASAQSARAQAIDTLKTTVAFPFMVGHVLLPAGTYEVVPDPDDPGLLEVRSEYGRTSAFATVLAGDTTSRRGDVQFQFMNVGGRYYLTQIDDGMGGVSQLVLPKAVMRELRASGRRPAVQK